MGQGQEEKLNICIATHAHWIVDFDVHFNHCLAMIQWSHKWPITMLGYKGLLAADAREKMCDQAVEQGGTHMFVLDADHFVHPSSLGYLLESKDEAMVSGVITRRFYPFNQVAWGKIDELNQYVPIEVGINGNVYQVGVCPFGCTLINLAKIQELEKPWFRDTCPKKADGKHANIRSDINLCDAFRANGENVWIDTRVLVGHMGTNIVIYPQNADDLRNFKHQYNESFKLKVGEAGEYSLPHRLL